MLDLEWCVNDDQMRGMMIDVRGRVVQQQFHFVMVPCGIFEGSSHQQESRVKASAVPSGRVGRPRILWTTLRRAGDAPKSQQLHISVASERGLESLTNLKLWSMQSTTRKVPLKRGIYQHYNLAK